MSLQEVRKSPILEPDFTMSSLNQEPAAVHDPPLSLAIIGPDEGRRSAAATEFMRTGKVRIREFSNYPISLDDGTRLLQQGFDAFLIDLDSNSELALQLVERLCIDRTTIVMVFSSSADPDLMLSGMRAGAREFLTLPFNPQSIDKALRLVETYRRRPEDARKLNSKLLTFFGAKGGVGVTMIASNFAVALAEESGQRTLLIDLNLQMGDAAMNLGIESPYSTVDALMASSVLDAGLLSKFLVRHSSGLSLLAAPAELCPTPAVNFDIGTLLEIARKHFSYIVVDAGKKIDLKQLHLFEPRSTAYLVTQVGIPELRNANRLISQFADDSAPRYMEIVLNRYQSRFLGITDEQLMKAINKPIRWKIPNDFKAVKQMQSSSIPLVSQDRQSPLASERWLDLRAT